MSTKAHPLLSDTKQATRVAKRASERVSLSFFQDCHSVWFGSSISFIVLYGSEITAQLLLHGIQKVIIVARSEEKYNTTYDEWSVRKGIYLTENNSRVTFIKCDLGDIKDVYAAAQQIKQQTELIHILICNAGTHPSRLQSTSDPRSQSIQLSERSLTTTQVWASNPSPPSTSTAYTPSSRQTASATKS